MIIQTTRFGEIEIDDNLIFEFLNPILGFEEEKKYILIEHSQNNNFKWLQSVKTPELAFVVTVAGNFGIDYSFELPDKTQEELNIEDAEDLLALNVVVIPSQNPQNSTINLLAPIIFNVKNYKAGQIILSDSKFKVDYPLFKKEAVC